MVRNSEYTSSVAYEFQLSCGLGISYLTTIISQSLKILRVIHTICSPVEVAL